LYEVDVRDEEAVAAVFEKFRPDAVCHQAAQMSVSRSVREPGYDARVNIVGLLNVLSHAVRQGARKFVFASSGGVLYGEASEPAAEATPAAPISPYGISKWAGEQYLQFFVREHGLQAVSLRYSNVYGPRQNPHGEAGVVAIFCTRMLGGQTCTIHGDGRYVRDYVYVADVACANVSALEHPGNAGFLPLNVGTGLGTDVNELAEILRQHCQRIWQQRGNAGEIPEPNHGPPRPGDLRSNIISAARAGEVLGWQPKVALTEGLQQTVDWFAKVVR
jgi:UDP-glucose 4-epimerase